MSSLRGYPGWQQFIEELGSTGFFRASSCPPLVRAFKPPSLVVLKVLTLIFYPMPVRGIGLDDRLSISLIYFKGSLFI